MQKNACCLKPTKLIQNPKFNEVLAKHKVLTIMPGKAVAVMSAAMKDSK